MARLAIYNGSTLIREVELTEGTLRIGRSDQNDIVLFDPAKAVSRFHAEVRFEGGACTIVDLNSQNGIWVAGRRVAHTTLAPGQAVLLGTYRLVLEARVLEQEVPERAMVMSAAPEAPVVSAPRPAMAPLPPPPVAPVPGSPAAPAPPPDSVRGESAPPVHAVSKVVPQPQARGAGRGHRILFVAAAAVCLAVVGVAGGIFWWPSAAGDPAASGRASDAPPPEDVLGGPPSEVSAAPTTPGAPAVPAQEAPPQPAPAAAPGRPADAPTPPVAVRLDGSAKLAGAAPAARPRRGAPVPPPRKEPAASPKPVPEPRAQVNTVQLLEQARLAVAKGDHVAAAGFLNPVMQVDAGNPEALELLASVRAEGSEAYKRGRQFDAVGRTSDALAMYDKVVKLLPPDHPSARAAKERITALR